MFSLEKINQMQNLYSGADFPKLIAVFKELGMVQNQVDIQKGQVSYLSKDQEDLTQTGIKVKLIAPTADKADFLTILQNHQAGQAGIAGWISDLKSMTCSYYDRQGQTVYIEAIPA